MAAKKKNKSIPAKKFKASPFSDLKGLAVSEQEDALAAERVAKSASQDIYGSFADEMDLLGVMPMSGRTKYIDEEILELTEDEIVDADGLTEHEQFISAMDGLEITTFRDEFNTAESTPKAIPQRMRQLKRGRLKPQAKLDLHGATRAEVVPQMKAFLSQANILGFSTVLIVTGRGLHSRDGEPVLRTEAEAWLRDKAKGLVAEWSRAPREYGGDGALVIFLRNKQ